MLEHGRRVGEFFDGNGKISLYLVIQNVLTGKSISDVPISGVRLEEYEEHLEGENKKTFLRFLRKMLQWRPEDRSTARELLGDPWLTS